MLKGVEKEEKKKKDLEDTEFSARKNGCIKHKTTFYIDQVIFFPLKLSEAV